MKTRKQFIKYIKNNYHFWIKIIVVLAFAYGIKKYFFKRELFPFPEYNFSELTEEQYNNLLNSNHPVLFKNTLKFNIEWKDFCKNLSNKKLKVRTGDYGTTIGRRERKFKNEKLGKLCDEIHLSNQYGGNNIITREEQNKINLVSSNPNINIFRTGKLWIGPSNSRTPLHKDGPENLAIQIYGEKKWQIFDKKDNDKLCFNKNNSNLQWSRYSINNYLTCPTAFFSKKYEIIMKSGDMLYLPKQWAHDVENKSKSIMINYWNKPIYFF